MYAQVYVKCWVVKRPAMEIYENLTLSAVGMRLTSAPASPFGSSLFNRDQGGVMVRWTTRITARFNGILRSDM